MSSNQSSSQRRLSQVKDFLTLNKRPTSIPWDPDCTIFPTRKELPQINGAPDGAAWVWGADDWVQDTFLLQEKVYTLILSLAWTDQFAYPYESKSCCCRN